MLALTISTINDADVLDLFVRYHFDQGVDAIVAIDMGSDDGTLDILRQYEKSSNLFLIDVDREQNRERSDRRNRMLRYCEDTLGVQWTMSADPDEFWYCPNGNLRDIVEGIGKRGADMMLCRRYNLINAHPGQALLTEPKFNYAPFRYSVRKPYIPSLQEKEALEIPLPWVLCEIGPKVILRAGSARTIQVGAHGASGDTELSRAKPKHISVLHFPLRSYKQFEGKVVKAAEFVAANRLAGNDAWHWRRWIRMLENGQLEQEYRASSFAKQQIERWLETGAIALENGLQDRLRRVSTLSTQGYAVSSSSGRLG